MQPHKTHKTQGFTLVELVVVATILAILSAVGFVAYTGYISGARDSNRIAQLANITDGLNVLTAQSALPIPEDNVEVIIGGETIAYQGYAGQSILDTIGLEKGGKDPKDDTFFTYYLDAKRSSFQLMAFLEEQGATSLFSQETYANDYSSRIPTVYGQKLGVLTDQFNTPIQEIETIKNSGNLTITSSTTGYIAHITEIEQYVGSDLININPNLSCKRIKEINGSAKSGVFSVNQDGTSSNQVYCDMETDGGGWTMATMIADDTTGNLFETGVSNTIVYPEDNISTKGNISEIWLTGDKRDLLIKCFTDDERFKPYEKPFIVYDFNFSDIGNLTKTTKANTEFTSIPLTGMYNGKTMNIVNNYTGGGGASMYIYGTLDGQGPGRLSQFAGSNSMYNSSLGTPGAPGNIPSGTARVYFNDQNYCITAVR